MTHSPEEAARAMTSASALLDSLDALFLRSNTVARGHVEALRSRIEEMEEELERLRGEKVSP